ncbi:putative RNA polymerase II subunit B1 CTD phosphatase RPAP2 homolog isoform X2 [Malania oleifera]|uniref:putative RNA polymerase II subunit B1 CTD phosphatase RPAP2 homolog isoform X2 n=1 Tax=Malania oleifera TaxID=397392 RepID=UPI0025ADCD63|nr:putative RNA polymerase II subunit B1 CTD phosphatase RPAP2 homolog isoform X2 [Malania oleifera]
MANKDHAASVKDAVHKLQLALLKGIQNEDHLFSAGTLLSRGDYQDVVTERSITNLCGYPLCANPLPSIRPRKGRYRISLKEHKVYDLHETYLYCSSACVVNSRAFAASLQEERCSVVNPLKIDEVLRLFGDLSLEFEEGLGQNGKLGFSDLTIQEKPEAEVGEVSLQDWVGPSNAIEGYVPQIDRATKPECSKNCNKESKSNRTKEEGMVFNEMDFMSAIISEDEYSISKTAGQAKTVSNTNVKESKGKSVKKDVGGQFTILETTSVPLQNEAKQGRHEFATKEVLSIAEVSSGACQNSSNVNSVQARKDICAESVNQSSGMLKSSLKSLGVKKPARTVTWADEKTDSVGNGDLCEVQEMEFTKEGAERSNSSDMGGDDDSFRFASAEACATALSQAAEAAASGESNGTDAASEAGIIILPCPHDADEGECEEETDVLEPEPTPSNWPRKPGITPDDLFDPEDSWYDSPPEGFCLTLSPFAMMWMALFAWITSSSLAYIYGGDESTHEDFLLVNGREYPRKIVLSDGRSSEIKQTLAGCLARALPGLVADLRLPTPLSSLEKGLGSVKA